MSLYEFICPVCKDTRMFDVDNRSTSPYDEHHCKCDAIFRVPSDAKLSINRDWATPEEFGQEMKKFIVNNTPQ